MIAPIRRLARARLAPDEPTPFERLLAELSSHLLGAPAESIDDEIRHWLSRLREYFEVDRTALVQLSAHSPRLHVTQVNDRRTGTRLADYYGIQELGACVAAISQGEVVRLRRIADLGSAGEADRRTLEAAGVRALLATPLSVASQPLGFLALMTERERAWSDEQISRLQLIAGMVAGSLLRRNSDRSLRSSDALSGAVLASLSARVAVLDRNGRIVRVNQAWQGFATVIGGGKAEVGDNYLDACRAAVVHDAAAADVVRGIESVLSGEGASGFRTEYGSSPGNGWRWDELVVEPLRVAQGGAVVMLTDATVRKRAELEAEAHRAEAAHAARGATLGELAAGLAHELNQPLAAILTNVQASQRLLGSEPLRMELLRDIMNDIAADDVRAAEIIRRMRALLTKGQRDVQPLDLSQLAGDVLRLVASDAILRRVRIHSRLEPDLPGIVGDRVQLQQVILNLVVNGLESMSDVAPGQRHLTIRTGQPDPDSVEVTVEDTGPGISAETMSRIYEPFFSTKPDGLGMGLSICRSIAEAHGGRLEASNGHRGGARFVFTLPVAGTPHDTHSPRQEQRSYVEHGTDRLRR
ncbi:MAG TPA: ATP-binding protein [Gemmatimonadales bacterium]|nr:ATP-binding protein [Gemmatimonadales bacterium]